MDPGTALAVATLAFDVTKQLYDYYRTWKDCEKDVTEVREHLLWLHQAFKVSRDIVRKPDLAVRNTDLLYSALEFCNDAANDLRDILEKIRKQETPQTAWDKLKAQGRKSCYPFRKSTITAIKGHVDACRDELEMAVSLLQLDTATDMHPLLRALDERLVDRFDNLDDALGQLPSISAGVSATQKLIRSVETTTEAMSTDFRTEKELADLKAMLVWFCDQDYSQQLNDIYRRRQDGTGLWFLESPLYEAWSRGDVTTLVSPGPPGAGKTVMAATVIHELLQVPKSSTVAVIYLFFTYKTKQEQTTDHLLGALIRQMLCFRVDVPASIKQLFQHHLGTRRPLREELKEAFSSLLRAFRKVHIVLDALDECQADVRTEILAIIREQQTGGSLHLLVTTRPVPNILEKFTECPELRLQAHDPDVARYLEANMKDLPQSVQKDQSLWELIIKTIIQAVEGIFLLAQLYMGSIKECTTPFQIKRALKVLPKDPDTELYSDAYVKTMERIQNQNKKHRALAIEALSLIVRARILLTREELKLALAVEVDTNAATSESSLLPVSDLLENRCEIDLVLSVCAGLLVLDEERDVVRLVHYTAQKFFEEHLETWLPYADSIIALKCIRYLSLEPFAQDLGKDWTAGDVCRRISKHPLLYYSALHWADHVSDVYRLNVPGHMSVRSASLFFLKDKNLVVSATGAWDIFGRKDRGYVTHCDTSGMHLLARLGASPLLEALQKTGRPVDVLDDKKRTPLSHAAELGHGVVVGILLGIDLVDADSRDLYSRTPLSYAAEGGHEAIVQLLLRTGNVDVDLGDYSGRTPLFYAAEQGHEVVVQLLLQTGKVDFNHRDWLDGETPLLSAANWGHTAVVRLLLQTGNVDVDSRDDLGTTPLSRAA